MLSDNGRIDTVQFSYILESLHIGPVSGEDALAERIDLDLPRDLEAGALEAKIESSDPAEQ